VIFNSNGGTGSMSNQVANIPTALTTNAFTRTNYTFSGWNTAANGSGTPYANGATYPFDADTTLFAQWTQVNHTVIFNSNGGTGSMSNQVANAPTALTTNTFTRTNYTFSGWNTAANGSGTPYANGATYDFVADATLYAQWTQINHTVIFNSNGGTGSMSNQVANAPTALTTNTFTRTNYTFSGWNTLANGTGTAYANGATYSFTADATLYAQWTQVNHTVIFNANGGTGSMSNQVANAPTVLTTNTFTRTNYTFSGWNTAANGSGTPYANGATYDFVADATLYAQWTQVNHTVIFNSNGGTGSMSNQVANAPTALTTNAFTRTNYTFSGWNTLANGTGTAYANGATYSFIADATLYAQWTQVNHTVVFNNNGGTGSMSNQVANAPTALTTNTFTRLGYSFSGWNTAANGSGTAYVNGATYSFVADATMYAQWISSAKAITAYSFTSPAATGVINEGAHTIAIIVPAGTNVTTLVATFTTTGASVKVGSTVQTSDVTPNNFTSPVTYTVTAADASTQDYVVTVTYPPTVTTQAVTGTKMTIATGNGTITDLGVPNATQYGVVWSTALNPTIADSKTTQGVPGGTGAFISNIIGLTPNTLYHVRAYATNAAGTSYGADVTFNTHIFVDVPIGYSQTLGGVSYPLGLYIVSLYNAGYTAGCQTPGNPLSYCPTRTFRRDESAVFMLRGLFSGSYGTPDDPLEEPSGELFDDMDDVAYWGTAWAEAMFHEGLTAGCQVPGNPLAFCPSRQLPRVEASVFALRLRYGVTYGTPANPLPAATGTMFADMIETDPDPANWYWGTAWAEKAYADGLLPNCGIQVGGPNDGKPLFCAGTLVDRAWAAYMVVKANNLPMP
jgi:uncharacterized repeat protein (TIGR02543 family)